MFSGPLPYSALRPLFTVVQQRPFFCLFQVVKEDSLLLGLKSGANGREIAPHAPLIFAAAWVIESNKTNLKFEKRKQNRTLGNENSDKLLKNGIKRRK